MTVATPAAYTVNAYNSARDSENKMHDDEVARAMGFHGGLVPGVDVFAYLSHVPLQFWGRPFLERGRLEARFLKPIYEGDAVTVTGQRDQGALQLEAASNGEVIAVGRAELPAAPPEVSLDDYWWVAPPEETQRPEISRSIFKVGDWISIHPRSFTRATLQEHLDSVREADPIYAAEGIVHPGSLVRLANFALMQNARLPPWIHVSSTLQMLRPARVGDELMIWARVSRNYERKGRRFVELDGLVVANRCCAIARLDHKAIYT